MQESSIDYDNEITTKWPRVYNVKSNFVQCVIQDFTGL